MSEPITASEARQILDVLKELQGNMQALTIEVKVTQAQLKALDDKVDGVRTELKTEIRAVNEKVDSLRSELRDNISELRTQQRSTDARLWTFILGLVTLVGGSVIKVLWFDRA